MRKRGFLGKLNSDCYNWNALGENDQKMQNALPIYKDFKVSHAMVHLLDFCFVTRRYILCPVLYKIIKC